MPQINLDLEQAKKFIEGIKYSSYRGLMKCEPLLWQGFRTSFRVSHTEVVQISDLNELSLLIRNRQHRPAHARPGPPYNQDYLARKKRYGEYYPHKFWNYGFWMGTDINMIGESLVMKTPPIIERGFNYLAKHERTRSVMKKAFLNVWQDIIDTIIDNYMEEAQQK
jgi:hypothetical protein